jgi:hypothetical protein
MAPLTLIGMAMDHIKKMPKSGTLEEIPIHKKLPFGGITLEGITF